jgi:uncharacterized membrane protein
MDQSAEQGDVRASLRTLEARIAAIEAHLGVTPEEIALDAPADRAASSPQNEEAMELQIGENWFAKMGILVLALGMVFLLTFPYRNLPPALPSLAGYLIAGGIIWLAARWRQSHAYISGYLVGGGIALLFFATLRLSFFAEVPALTDRAFLTVLLACAVAVGFLLATRAGSPTLTVLSFLLGCLACMISDNPPVLFAGLTVLSLLGVLYALRYQWHWLLALAAGLVLLAHFLWFLNNPVLGNRLDLVTSPHYNIFFLLAYIGIFAAGSLWRARDGEEAVSALITAIVSAGGGYALFLLLTVTKFQDNLVVSHLIASAVLLGIAVTFWMRYRSVYSTFVYAMLGYAALSVAIVDQFSSPEYFIGLSLASLLVLSTAVWFRSRLIVAGNFVIFLCLFFAFLIVAQDISLISICFGIVALLSARILNWQRDRLTLKTEQMRNAYLGTAFFMIPYALFHAVPPGFVSISWLIVALFYYLMSRMLNSSKYRWMGLLTLAITIPYAFLVDMTRLDPTFRIVSFIVLGTVLLAVSISYSKRRAASARPPEAGGKAEGHTETPVGR